MTDKHFKLLKMKTLNEFCKHYYNVYYYENIEELIVNTDMHHCQVKKYQEKSEFIKVVENNLNTVLTDIKIKGDYLKIHFIDIITNKKVILNFTIDPYEDLDDWKHYINSLKTN